MDRKTKERQNQLASNIRRSHNDASDGIKELLSLQIDEVKDSLVNSIGAQTLKLQGEAQALSRLYKLLTVEPISIKSKDQ